MERILIKDGRYLKYRIKSYTSNGCVIVFELGRRICPQVSLIDFFTINQQIILTESGPFLDISKELKVFHTDYKELIENLQESFDLEKTFSNFVI